MTDEPIQEAEPAPKREVQTLYVAEAEDGIRLDRWFRRHMPDVPSWALSGMVGLGARLRTA